MLNRFLTTSKNVERSSYLWNMAASIISAAQSVVMLFGVSNILGAEPTGIFSIATAQAFIFWTIGCFGVRRFQASDVNRLFTQREYIWSRVITAGLMVVSAIVFLFYQMMRGTYDSYKLWVIVLMVALRLVDVIDDFFGGYFQQTGRLDIGSRMTTVRFAVTTVVFVGALIATGDLLMSLLITFGVSLGLLGVLVVVALRDYDPDRKSTAQRTRVVQLLRACFPLFLSTFMLMYINNSPRYGIDAVLDETAQANFGLIYMPVFIIYLLASLIFNPLIYKMSTYWLENQLKAFRRSVVVVSAIIAGVTLVCVLGGVTVGLPILSWMSGLDLSGLTVELGVLLLAGGVIALSTYFTTVLTIMRRQTATAWMLGVVTVCSLSANLWASWLGVLGVCLLLLVLYALNSLLTGGLLWWTLHRKEQSLHDKEST
ncbi:MAG: oligosaccharide flippase family protein [Propionibacteriaceae bacterium]|nr:oligosaccharide flippase family protein [Propionibacteriaceae bacterium]